MRLGNSGISPWFFALFILIPVLVPGCAKTVAEVGSIPITSKDIALRIRVSEVYYPGSGKDFIGLTQLIKGYLSEEVLKSLDQKVGPETWEAEAKRIDLNTKAPAVLEKIKDVYGRDRKAYLNNFVRVVYAERAVYNEVFLTSAAIHQQQRNNAENFLQAALRSPADFNQEARLQNLEAKKLRLSASEGILPLAAGEQPRANPGGAGQDQAQRLIAAISPLKPGAVTPKLIEWQEGYQVLRFLKKAGNDYLVESVNIPKRGFDEWFWEQAARVPVRIHDQKLKAELLGNVGWARKLKLE